VRAAATFPCRASRVALPNVGEITNQLAGDQLLNGLKQRLVGAASRSSRLVRVCKVFIRPDDLKPFLYFSRVAFSRKFSTFFSLSFFYCLYFPTPAF
jgi:hypothetical protein